MDNKSNMTLRVPSKKTNGNRNLNSTTIANSNSAHKLRTSTPNSTINLSVQSNFDIAGVSSISSKNNPKIKTNLSTCFTPTVDNELECEIAYNEYLQALMKKQIAQKTIENHKQILNEQLIVQSDVVHEMKNSKEQIKSDIEELNEQSKSIVLMEFLQENLQETNTLFSKHDLNSLLVNLINILENQCNRVALKNINKLESQAEFDKLVKILDNCNTIMEKWIHSGRDFKGVNVLADTIKMYSQLKTKVKDLDSSITNLQKEAVNDWLKNMSDMFALKGGYY